MNKNKESLGDRMKLSYEDRFRFYLPRRIPVIVRLDGKAFHSYTKHFIHEELGPFRYKLSDAMIDAGKELVHEIQGFKLAYVQSDEISILLTDYDRPETVAWFGYNKSKMESIAASYYTVFFNKAVALYTGNIDCPPAFFDARSFSVPREDVANYFLWRAKDWERNSLAMYCQHFFSPKHLHGKNRNEQHELLQTAGKNWEVDLEDRWKNGTWLYKDENGRIGSDHSIPANFTRINNIIQGMLITPPIAQQEGEVC